MNTLLIVAGWMLVILIVGAYLSLREIARVYPVQEETYREGREWRWRIRGVQGDVVAESSCGYKARHHAFAAARAVRVDGLEP